MCRIQHSDWLKGIRQDFTLPDPNNFPQENNSACEPGGILCSAWLDIDHLRG
jgi:hypothetical protein